MMVTLIIQMSIKGYPSTLRISLTPLLLPLNTLDQSILSFIFHIPLDLSVSPVSQQCQLHFVSES